MALLEINDLNLSIGSNAILKDINLTIEPGEIRGIVGESGSGKSLTAFSVMQLLPNQTHTTGQIVFDGKNLLDSSEENMCQLRGDDLAMVFQEPMTALNPLKTIGDQVAEGIVLHRKVSKSEAIVQTEAIMAKVGLPPSLYPLSRYPDELSGGQRQRVVIAIACAMRPKLLIADEPTTALDVTVQATILELLKDLAKDFGMGLMLISHDLGVVAEVSDTITIMRHGQIMESGPALAVLRAQKHPYTKQLAKASAHIPERISQPVLSQEQLTIQPLLKIDDLTVSYRQKRKHWFDKPAWFNAVDHLSFQIYPGQTMALIGESGCGKSTLARTILGLQKPNGGTITFNGNQIAPDQPDAMIAARRDMQIVFQDPYGSFNPRHKVGRLVSEPLFLSSHLTKTQKREAVIKALVSVGLSETDTDKFAHEFSGGQRQRIAIARALVTEPKLIIADEPVSALDVSIRAQILDLLSELRDRLGVAYLFISHDLSVVRAFCDEVMIMRDGKIIEQNAAEDIFTNAQSDYTRTLIDAAPDLERAIA